MTPLLNDPAIDTIIHDLHRTREGIVNSYGGDLHALTNDARQRQEKSGRRIWRRTASAAASRVDAKK